MKARARLLAGAVPVLPLLACLYNPAIAAQGDEEVVSFRCALAIDAVLARLDEQVENLVIQQALERINENIGELVCIFISRDEVQVRLQATDMTAADNRLVFVLDAKTYTVRKTYYGR